jgi:hypothetical protein
VFALGTKRIVEESKQRERPKGPFCNYVIKSRKRQNRNPMDGGDGENNGAFCPFG